MLYQGAKSFPRVVIGHRRTENETVFGIQRFFRRDHNNSQSKDKSFIYGNSTANQQIES